MRRMLFTSTVVTGDARGAVLDEETALPVETAYGRSKQEGERLLRDSSLEDVIIRPSHVYGSGGWFVEEFVDRLRKPGRFAVIGSGENWWDVVRVEDVASACADAAERAPAGSLYHVVDDEPITFYDFVALAATALGPALRAAFPPGSRASPRARDPVSPSPARLAAPTPGSSPSSAGPRASRPLARAFPMRSVTCLEATGHIARQVWRPTTGATGGLDARSHRPRRRQPQRTKEPAIMAGSGVYAPVGVGGLRATFA